jgi:hypothetical protein
MSNFSLSARVVVHHNSQGNKCSITYTLHSVDSEPPQRFIAGKKKMFSGLHVSRNFFSCFPACILPCVAWYTTHTRTRLDVDDHTFRSSPRLACTVSVDHRFLFSLFVACLLRVSYGSQPTVCMRPLYREPVAACCT